jgi:hypothetical protein
MVSVAVGPYVVGDGGHGQPLSAQRPTRSNFSELNESAICRASERIYRRLAATRVRIHMRTPPSPETCSLSTAREWREQ